MTLKLEKEKPSNMSPKQYTGILPAQQELTQKINDFLNKKFVSFHYVG